MDCVNTRSAAGLPNDRGPGPPEPLSALRSVACYAMLCYALFSVSAWYAGPGFLGTIQREPYGETDRDSLGWECGTSQSP